jgi:hypothetical protein
MGHRNRGNPSRRSSRGETSEARLVRNGTTGSIRKHSERWTRGECPHPKFLPRINGDLSPHTRSEVKTEEEGRMSRRTCGHHPVHFFSHGGRGCQPAPGLPRALCFQRSTRPVNLGRHACREIAELHLLFENHINRAARGMRRRSRCPAEARRPSHPASPDQRDR